MREKEEKADQRGDDHSAQGCLQACLRAIGHKPVHNLTRAVKERDDFMRGLQRGLRIYSISVEGAET